MRGTYDSKTGIYCFDGKYWKAKWDANALRKSLSEIKLILEEGSEPNAWGKAILVSGKAKMQEIIDAGFGSWSGLGKLHYFDTTISAGSIPDWVQGFNSYSNLLMHEYAPGLVVWMRPDSTIANDMYIFFEESEAPPAPPPPPPPPPVPPQEVVGIPTWLWIMVSSMFAIIGLLLGILIKS